MRYKKCIIKFIICLTVFVFMHKAGTSTIYAQDTSGNENILPNISINVEDSSESTQNTATTIQIILLITIITLAPSFLIMFTSFTRIIISLHFLRAALGTQQMPPNQILIGLALFLTIFIMGPVFTQINDTAFQPFSKGEINQEQFIEKSMEPIRTFMFSQVEDKDIALFTNIANIESYKSKEDIPNTVLMPAFVLGELTKGFKIGFIIYIPFIAIDMVVASTLMAMGMMMLPPAMISAPFKILLFIMVDGWSLVIGNLIKTFHMGLGG